MYGGGDGRGCGGVGGGGKENGGSGGEEGVGLMVVMVWGSGGSGGGVRWGVMIVMVCGVVCGVSGDSRVVVVCVCWGEGSDVGGGGI